MPSAPEVFPISICTVPSHLLSFPLQTASLFSSILFFLLCFPASFLTFPSSNYPIPLPSFLFLFFLELLPKILNFSLFNSCVKDFFTFHQKNEAVSHSSHNSSVFSPWTLPFLNFFPLLFALSLLPWLNPSPTLLQSTLLQSTIPLIHVLLRLLPAPKSIVSSAWLNIVIINIEIVNIYNAPHPSPFTPTPFFSL